MGTEATKGHPSITTYEDLLRELLSRGGMEVSDVSDRTLRACLRGIDEIYRKAESQEVQRLIMGVSLLFQDELHRRENVLLDARIQVEANGHEVLVHEDRYRRWLAFCWCRREALGKYPTEQEAVEVAGRHAVGHGGRWAEPPIVRN